ncbi:MAG TPA: murein L,D-transpeptidase catalytic domain family protein [Saprospiraceae bacterium]|nr:murein L,D-transpeptidase catalytic domain family protein [Saprospiraceae bacterium]
MRRVKVLLILTGLVLWVGMADTATSGRSYDFTSGGTPLSATELIQACGLQDRINPEVVSKAIEGYERFGPKKPILAICDFSKPSDEPRFYVIDLAEKKLLLNTLVAHGKNSGERYAEHFSNKKNSLQSSLGFFRIGDKITSPKHGKALLLEGLEKGKNDNARSREIIMHGAPYVSEAFIKKTGRLGRSFGCPALPVEVMGEVLPVLADGGLLYIYSNN